VPRRIAISAAPGAALRDLREGFLGVGQLALLGRHVAGLQQRVLVVRLDLEDLLVERRGLWIEALAGQVIRDAGVLLDALLDLLGAHVQIAERVRRVPVTRLGLDDLYVLGDGGVDLAQLEGFLGGLEGGVTIERRHSDCSQTMLSNRVAGLNVRR
jgi:hypothetical protein